MATARDRSTDVLRALAIILVVLGHTNRGIIDSRGSTTWDGLRWLDFILYALHMPTFFYLAGYYAQRSLERHTVLTFARARWGAIIYPYLFWSVAYFAINKFASLFTHINSPITESNLVEIWCKPIHILWFLYALFLLQCLAIVFKLRPIAFLSFAVCVFSIFSMFETSQAPVLFVGAVHNSVFFGIGFLLASRGFDVFDKDLRRPFIVAVATIAFFTVLSFAFVLGERNPAQIWLTPISCAGVIMLAKCARSLRDIGWLQFAGRESLAIYLLHIVFLAFVPRMLSVMGFQSSLLTLTVGTVFGVFGSLAAFRALQALRLAGVAGLMPPEAPGTKWLSALDRRDQ